MNAMPTPLIELRGVSRLHRTGDHETYALRDVDLVIRSGEFVALMGPSGSGKSTLLNILGCLDRPTAGGYLFDRHETTQYSPSKLAALRRDAFGFIFQRYNLLPQLSAVANVETPAIYAGMRAERRQARAKALLAELGLSDRLANRPSQLSGGQQQRVSIARALMNGGAVILADEPTGALDSVTGRETMALLAKLNREGHTLIIATHDAHVASYAGRIVTIEDGRIVEDRRTGEARYPEAAPPTLAAPSEQSLPPLRLGAPPALFGSLLEAARMALFALLAHRLRTSLTLLGVIIGIVSVVMMVAVGEGAQRAMKEALKSMPPNFLWVFPGKFVGDPDAGNLRTLTLTDVDVLKKQYFIENASPEIQESTTLRLGARNSAATVMGVNEDYFAINGLKIDRGRGFTHEEVATQQQIVLIDANVRWRFFRYDDPIGQIIHVGRLPCVIIGSIAKNATMEGPGAVSRLNVWMPYSTVGVRIAGRSNLNGIVLRFHKSMPMNAVVKGVEDVMERRHKAKDILVYNLEETIRADKAVTDSTTLWLGVVGVVSLIVGGIGVMNIMLVSVSERAREIGVRMAVGARRADIQTQFLIEAIVVCLIGGVAGVLLSYALVYLAGSYLPDTWKIVLSTSAVSIAFLSSMLTGVVFGYVPARNAARLDPVEALSRD